MSAWGALTVGAILLSVEFAGIGPDHGLRRVAGGGLAGFGGAAAVALVTAGWPADCAAAAGWPAMLLVGGLLASGPVLWSVVGDVDWPLASGAWTAAAAIWLVPAAPALAWAGTGGGAVLAFGLAVGAGLVKLGIRAGSRWAAPGVVGGTLLGGATALVAQGLAG